MNVAELFGVMMGDGCLSRYKSGKCVALLTGNLANDYEYYVNTIQPILRKHFKLKDTFTNDKKETAIIYGWENKFLTILAH